MEARVGRVYGTSTVAGSDLIGIAPSGRRRYVFHMACSCGTKYDLSEKALGRAIEPCPTCRFRVSGQNPRSSRLYSVWSQMHNRCNNPNSKSYKNYGGRGITVCTEWTGKNLPEGTLKSIVGFKQFLEDMGESVVGRTLDRIDNDLGYSPKNCRWATPTEQAANKRTDILVTIAGRKERASHWASAMGVDSTKMLALAEKREITVSRLIKLLMRKINGKRLPKSAR